MVSSAFVPPKHRRNEGGGRQVALAPQIEPNGYRRHAHNVGQSMLLSRVERTHDCTASGVQSPHGSSPSIPVNPKNRTNGDRDASLTRFALKPLAKAFVIKERMSVLDGTYTQTRARLKRQKGSMHAHVKDTRPLVAFLSERGMSMMAQSSTTTTTTRTTTVSAPPCVSQSSVRRTPAFGPRDDPKATRRQQSHQQSWPHRQQQQQTLPPVGHAPASTRTDLAPYYCDERSDEPTEVMLSVLANHLKQLGEVQLPRCALNAHAVSALDLIHCVLGAPINADEAVQRLARHVLCVLESTGWAFSPLLTADGRSTHMPGVNVTFVWQFAEAVAHVLSMRSEGTVVRRCIRSTSFGRFVASLLKPAPSKAAPELRRILCLPPKEPCAKQPEPMLPRPVVVDAPLVKHVPGSSANHPVVIADDPPSDTERSVPSHGGAGHPEREPPASHLIREEFELLPSSYQALPLDSFLKTLGTLARAGAASPPSAAPARGDEIGAARGHPVSGPNAEPASSESVTGPACDQTNGTRRREPLSARAETLLTQTSPNTALSGEGPAIPLGRCQQNARRGGDDDDVFHYVRDSAGDWCGDRSVPVRYGYVRCSRRGDHVVVIDALLLLVGMYEHGVKPSYLQRTFRTLRGAGWTFPTGMIPYAGRHPYPMVNVKRLRDLFCAAMDTIKAPRDLEYAQRFVVSPACSLFLSRMLDLERCIRDNGGPPPRCATLYVKGPPLLSCESICASPASALLCTEGPLDASPIPGRAPTGTHPDPQPTKDTVGSRRNDDNNDNDNDNDDWPRGLVIAEDDEDDKEDEEKDERSAIGIETTKEATSGPSIRDKEEEEEDVARLLAFHLGALSLYSRPPPID